MIFAGFKFAPVPNWDVIAPIKAPSNYKKPEAIAKYIAERKAQLATGGAAVDALTGTVEAVHVIDTNEKDGKGTLLTGNDIFEFFDLALARVRTHNTVVGYKVNRAMKLLALMKSMTNDGGVHVDVFKFIDRAYNVGGGFVDPVGLLFGTSETDLNAAAMRCGVTVNPEDPGNLAEFAREVLRNVSLESDE